MSVLVGESWTDVLKLPIPGPFEPHMPGIARWFAEHPPGAC